MLSDSYDVIVVGGGGAGLAAAVASAERGRRVLLLEKNPQLGGTTGIATGINGSLDKVPVRAGCRRRGELTVQRLLPALRYRAIQPLAPYAGR